MNILFGNSSFDRQSDHFTSISDYITLTYQQSSRRQTFEHPVFNLGVSPDNSKLCNIATTDHITLAYLGSIYGPLPEWTHDVSPLDDGNITAQYLLKQYSQKGQNIFAEIYGQYAIAIINEKTQNIKLISDPSGLRTFFYSKFSNELLFSSNISSIAKSAKFPFEINRSHEDFFLIYGFYPFNQTVYDNIQSLPAGSCLSFDPENFHLTKLTDNKQKGSEPDKQQLENIHEDELVELIYKHFMEAMEGQLSSDDGAAVLLGGFDSALVASALCKLGKKVETFSFHYEDTSFNQPHTDSLAKLLNIGHNWIPITQNTLHEGMLSYSKTFNAPTNWLNYVVQTKAVCEAIHYKGYRHVYSGDGCDGVFMGYPRTHLQAKLFSRFGHFSEIQLKMLLAVLTNPKIGKLLGRLQVVLLNIVRSLARKGNPRGHINFRVFDESILSMLRDDKPPQAYNIDEILESLSNELSELSADRKSYHGKSLVSPNKLKLIGSSDSTGVSIHSPYLHPRLKDFALHLPDKALRPINKAHNQNQENAATNGKYILCKMAEKKGLLPNEIIYQKKMAAVTGPIDHWYYNDLYGTILEQLGHLPFNSNKNYIKQLLTDSLIEQAYKNYFSSDDLTTHGISLLCSYADFSK